MEALPNGSKPWLFQKGNPGGPGNPHAAQVARLRAMLLDSATDERMRATIDKLWSMAADGDMVAIKEIFDRLFGKPKQAVELEGALELFKRIVLDKAAPGDNGSKPGA